MSLVLKVVGIILIIAIVGMIIGAVMGAFQSLSPVLLIVLGVAVAAGVYFYIKKRNAQKLNPSGSSTAIKANGSNGNMFSKWFTVTPKASSAASPAGTYRLPT